MTVRVGESGDAEDGTVVSVTTVVGEACVVGPGVCVDVGDTGSGFPLNSLAEMPVADVGVTALTHAPDARKLKDSQSATIRPTPGCRLNVTSTLFEVLASICNAESGKGLCQMTMRLEA